MAIGMAVVIGCEVVIYDETGKRSGHIILHNMHDSIQGYTATCVCVATLHRYHVYDQAGNLKFSVYRPPDIGP